MFIATLLTTAKRWKRPRCPSADEWVKKMLYMFTREHCSAIRKNAIMSFAATWMDPEVIILSEKVRQKKTNIM